MKSITFFLLVCIVSITTGCPKNMPKLDLTNDNHKNLLVSQLKENVFKKQWIEYNCSHVGYYNVGLAGNKFDKFACGDVYINEGRAEEIRNEVSSNGLGLIDSVYVVYISNIRRNRSIGEFIADVLALGGSTTSVLLRESGSYTFSGHS